MGQKMDGTLTSINLGLLSNLLGASPACQGWQGQSENRVGGRQDGYSSRNNILIGEIKGVASNDDAQDENSRGTVGAEF